MALDWYFLRIQVGREDRIRESMVRRLKQAGIENLVPQIVVPTETIADHRQGKKTVKRRKLYPGYLMVQMDLSDDVWFVLRRRQASATSWGGTPSRRRRAAKTSKRSWPTWMPARTSPRLP
jgi:transcriptional antiterminator NusG